MVAAALAAPLPVATHTLEPGSILTDADVRWVEVDDRQVEGDTWPDPVGRLVVERVLGGEPVRAERLLDPDKPERFAPPGLRALRVPSGPGPDWRGEWVDLRVEGECNLLHHLLVLGPGKGADGDVDSWFVLMAPEHALRALAERRPMALAAADAKVPLCSR